MLKLIKWIERSWLLLYAGMLVIAGLGLPLASIFKIGGQLKNHSLPPV